MGHTPEDRNILNTHYDKMHTAIAFGNGSSRKSALEWVRNHKGKIVQDAQQGVEDAQGLLIKLVEMGYIKE